MQSKIVVSSVQQRCCRINFVRSDIWSLLISHAMLQCVKNERTKQEVTVFDNAQK